MLSLTKLFLSTVIIFFSYSSAPFPKKVDLLRYSFSWLRILPRQPPQSVSQSNHPGWYRNLPPNNSLRYVPSSPETDHSRQNISVLTVSSILMNVFLRQGHNTCTHESRIPSSSAPATKAGNMDSFGEDRRCILCL